MDLEPPFSSSPTFECEQWIYYLVPPALNRVDNSCPSVATHAKFDQKQNMIYFFRSEILPLGLQIGWNTELIFNRCVYSYIYMVFYGSCFIGKIARLLHPSIFFQKTADLQHSTKSSCFTTLLTVKMWGFFSPLNIWRKLILVIHITVGVRGRGCRGNFPSFQIPLMR